MNMKSVPIQEAENTVFNVGKHEPYQWRFLIEHSCRFYCTGNKRTETDDSCYNKPACGCCTLHVLLKTTCNSECRVLGVFCHP